MRLDAFLTGAGAGSRREIKEQVRNGTVKVNGITVTKPESHINENTDSVNVNGKVWTYKRYVYYMLNKPAGVITATEDKKDKTVLDLIEDKRELFPVGRLDKDTEGLLIITNDGELAHRLLSPRKHVNKLYYAKVKGLVTESDIDTFRKGIEFREFTSMPAECKVISGQKTEEGYISETYVTVNEGKFHQVKRMFHAVGKEVLYLKRLEMGGIKLDESLTPGEYRELTKEELEKLC